MRHRNKVRTPIDSPRKTVPQKMERKIYKIQYSVLTAIFVPRSVHVITIMFSILIPYSYPSYQQCRIASRTQFLSKLQSESSNFKRPESNINLPIINFQFLFVILQNIGFPDFFHIQSRFDRSLTSPSETIVDA